MKKTIKKEVKQSIKVIINESIKYLIFLIVFILLSVFLLQNYSEYIIAFDNFIIDFNRNYLESEVLTSMMQAITHVGSYGSYLFIIIVSFIILRKKIIIPIFMIFAVGGSGIINKVVKSFIKRQRPETSLINLPESFSFPSGHTMCSVVFYMYLIHLVKEYVKSKSVRTILIVFLVTIPILIGYSRIYLNVHYASDVIAGAILGIITYIPFIKITNSLKEVFK